MVLTAYTALSSATNSSCHRRWRISGKVCTRLGRLASANLTPATGARTTRFCRPLQRLSSTRFISLTGNPPCETPRAQRCRVHRIPRRTSVTIAIRPLFSGTRRLKLVEVICPTGQAKSFLREGWTRNLQNCPSRLGKNTDYGTEAVRKGLTASHSGILGRRGCKAS